MQPSRKTDNRLEILPIEFLSPNPHQPRRAFPADGLRSMAESIKNEGLLQPVVVCPKEPDSVNDYFIIAGERRWRAVQLLGWGEIECKIKPYTNPKSIAKLTVIENTYRKELNPMELAHAFYNMSQSEEEGGQGLTVTELAKLVPDMSRSTVTNYIRLLKLPEQVRDLIEEGRLPFAHARHILSLPENFQTRIAINAANSRWSLKQLEDKTKGIAQFVKPKKRKEDRPSVFDQESQFISRNISEKYGCNSSLREKKGGGLLLEMHFNDISELQGALEKMKVTCDLYEE